MKFIIGLIIGFVIGVNGSLSSVVNFADKNINKAKEVVQEQTK
jgi:hypothetical protein